MDPELIMSILGGGSSLLGLITGNAAQNAARQQAAAALRNMSAANSGQYNSMISNQSNNLESMAGQGADAIANYSRGLGADLASAGVYNSTGAAGAIANMARGEQSALSNAAAQDYYSANQLYNQQQAQQAQMALGQSNVAYNQASGQYNNSLAGFGQFLNKLGQSDLLKSGSSNGGDNSGAGAYSPGFGTGEGPSTYGVYTAAPDAYGMSNPDPQGGPSRAIPMLGAPVAAAPMSGTGPTTTAPNGAPLGGSIPMPNYGVAPTRALPGYTPPPVYSPYSASGLGATTQQNLATSGANVSRLGLPGMNGTVNQGANLGGNAGMIGNGGQGAAGRPRAPFSLYNSPYFYGR